MTAAPTYPGERTALAWRRTAVAAMGTAVLFANHASTSGWRPAAIAPALAAFVLLCVAGLSYARNRSLQQGRWGNGPLVIAITTVAILAVTGVALAIGLTDPGKRQALSTDAVPILSDIPAVIGGRQ
ncbi:DUF202 domain-containing protein [Nocardia sp. CDC160]|uniref:DUF202 domain-containing protein n=1 Tax=Nocardia sp. CDC160 TaxID=3112166 RepID=UPI002DB9C739|nr:DUF202 domain-containing protein [Nocardia sp. CDC160]MEC3917145.1 DUF202 domain-containing protein [Nocardia sp. CDC160]